MAAESYSADVLCYEAMELIKLQPSFLSINWNSYPQIPTSIRFEKGKELFMQNLNAMFRRRSTNPWLSSKKKTKQISLKRNIPRSHPTTTQKFKNKISTILNKITPQNFTKLAQMTMDACTTKEEMNIIIAMVLELAVKQPMYCIQYVKLCSYLRDQYTDQDISEAFRKMIIIQTNAIFKKHQNHSTIPAEISETKKDNFFAVLVLVAELYNFHLIRKNILYIGIFDTLLPPKNKHLSSIDVEGLCHMFKRCGKKLESEGQKYADKYLQQITFHAKKFDFRTQVLVDQTNAMRRNNWRQADNTVYIGHNWFQKKLKHREAKCFSVQDNPTSQNQNQDQDVNILLDVQNIKQQIVNKPHVHVAAVEDPVEIIRSPVDHQNVDEMVCTAPAYTPSYGFIPLQAPINANEDLDEGKQCQPVPEIALIAEHDLRLNVLVASFNEIDSRFKAMTENVTTMLTGLEQKAINDMNTINQQFRATITNLYQQMKQQIEILSNKLAQTQQHTQRNMAYLQQQIIVLTQKQNEKDNDVMKLLQHMNKLQSNIYIKDEDPDECDECDEKISEEEKVRVWLVDKIRLPKYFQLFIKNGYDDLDIIADMNLDDLREINIDKIGHRKKILKYIKQLKEANPQRQSANVERHTTRSTPKKSIRKINWGYKKRNIMQLQQNDDYVINVVNVNRNIMYLDVLCSSASDGIYESLGFAGIVSTLIPILNRSLYKWIVESAPVYTKLSISNWSLDLGLDFVTFIGNGNIFTKQALFKYNNPYGLKELNIQCGAASNDWLSSICLNELTEYLENKQNLQTVVINIEKAKKSKKSKKKKSDNDIDTDDTFNSDLKDELINLLRSLVAVKTFIVKAVPFQIKSDFVSALGSLMILTDLRLYDKRIAWSTDCVYALKNNFRGLNRLGVCVNAINIMKLHIIADIANELIIKNTESKRKLNIQSLAILFARFTKIEIDASLIDNYPSIQNKTNVQILSIHCDTYDCVVNLFRNLPSSVKHLIIKRAKYSPLNLVFYERKQRNINQYNTLYVRELTLDGFDDIQQIKQIINSGLLVNLISVNIITQSYQKSIQVKQQLKSLYINKKIKVNIV